MINELNDNEQLKQFLDKKVEEINILLGKKPYYLIGSDNNDIQEYITHELSKTIYLPLDYSLIYPKRQIIDDKFRSGEHIILSNFDEKIKEYAQKEEFIKEANNDTAINAITSFKNYYSSNRKLYIPAMIIICSLKTYLNIIIDENIRKQSRLMNIDHDIDKAKILIKSKDVK